MSDRLRYKCLILDHDDTAVDSTASIHYPAYLEIMAKLRPGQQPESLEGWFRKNYNPGVYEYYTGELGFTTEEMQVEYDIWRNHTQSGMPKFYEGFLDLLKEFVDMGGLVTVVSHSDIDIIKKHYQTNKFKSSIEPEMIFGWDHDASKRKPNPYPVHAILDTLELGREDVLIVDDLKPGVNMGRNAGVSVAAAGWGHQIPEIREDMEKNCDYYFSSVDAFKCFLIEEQES